MKEEEIVLKLIKKFYKFLENENCLEIRPCHIKFFNRYLCAVNDGLNSIIIGNERIYIVYDENVFRYNIDEAESLYLHEKYKKAKELFEKKHQHNHELALIKFLGNE